LRFSPRRKGIGKEVEKKTARTAYSLGEKKKKKHTPTTGTQVSNGFGGWLRQLAMELKGLGATDSYWKQNPRPNPPDFCALGKRGSKTFGEQKGRRQIVRKEMAGKEG